MDPEAAPLDGEFSPEVWNALRDLSIAHAEERLPLVGGSAYEVALELHSSSRLPLVKVLRDLTAGELHRAVRLASTSEPEGLLAFDAQDGRRIVARAADYVAFECRRDTWLARPAANETSAARVPSASGSGAQYPAYSTASLETPQAERVDEEAYRNTETGGWSDAVASTVTSSHVLGAKNAICKAPPRVCA